MNTISPSSAKVLQQPSVSSKTFKLGKQIGCLTKEQRREFRYISGTPGMGSGFYLKMRSADPSVRQKAFENQAKSSANHLRDAKNLNKTLKESLPNNKSISDDLKRGIVEDIKSLFTSGNNNPGGGLRHLLSMATAYSGKNMDEDFNRKLSDFITKGVVLAGRRMRNESYLLNLVTFDGDFKAWLNEAIDLAGALSDTLPAPDMVAKEAKEVAYKMLENAEKNMEVDEQMTGTINDAKSSLFSGDIQQRKNAVIDLKANLKARCESTKDAYKTTAETLKLNDDTFIKLANLTIKQTVNEGRAKTKALCEGASIQTVGLYALSKNFDMDRSNDDLYSLNNELLKVNEALIRVKSGKSDEQLKNLTQAKRHLDASVGLFDAINGKEKNASIKEYCNILALLSSQVNNALLLAQKIDNVNSMDETNLFENKGNLSEVMSVRLDLNIDEHLIDGPSDENGKKLETLQLASEAYDKHKIADNKYAELSTAMKSFEEKLNDESATFDNDDDLARYLVDLFSAYDGVVSPKDDSSLMNKNVKDYVDERINSVDVKKYKAVESLILASSLTHAYAEQAILEGRAWRANIQPHKLWAGAEADQIKTVDALFAAVNKSGLSKAIATCAESAGAMTSNMASNTNRTSKLKHEFTQLMNIAKNPKFKIKSDSMSTDDKTLHLSEIGKGFRHMQNICTIASANQFSDARVYAMKTQVNGSSGKSELDIRKVRLDNKAGGSAHAPVLGQANKEIHNDEEFSPEEIDKNSKFAGQYFDIKLSDGKHQNFQEALKYKDLQKTRRIYTDALLSGLIKLGQNTKSYKVVVGCKDTQYVGGRFYMAEAQARNKPLTTNVQLTTAIFSAVTNAAYLTDRFALYNHNLYKDGACPTATYFDAPIASNIKDEENERVIISQKVGAENFDPLNTAVSYDSLDDLEENLTREMKDNPEVTQPAEPVKEDLNALIKPLVKDQNIVLGAKGDGISDNTMYILGIDGKRISHVGTGVSNFFGSKSESISYNEGQYFAHNANNAASTIISLLPAFTNSDNKDDATFYIPGYMTGRGGEKTVVPTSTYFSFGRSNENFWHRMAGFATLTFNSLFKKEYNSTWS